MKTTNGAITYAELSFIQERASSGVLAANVKNNGGRFVAPSTKGTAVFYSEAVVEADGLVTPDYSVASLDSYPINAIAYGLASKNVNTENTGVKNYFSFFLNTCAPATAAAK